MEWESNEREILIERATMELGRNMMLGKSPRIHNNDPAKTTSNTGKGA